MPVGAFITGVSSPTGTTPGVITIGQYSGSGTVIPAAASASTITPNITGIITAGSPIITNLSALAGILPGQPITWQAAPTGAQASVGSLPTNTVVYSVNPALGQVTMGTAASFVSGATTVNATNSSVVPFQGTISAGSLNTITVSGSTSAFFPGQIVTGPGLPTSSPYATIKAVGTSSILLSQNASATAPTGTVTISGTISAGSLNTITTTSSTSGLVPGQIIAGGNATGSIVSSPATVITAVGTNTITLSQNASAAITPAVPFTVSQTFYTGTTNTFTVATTETITIGTGSVTLSNNATVSSLNYFVTANTADAYDVQPVDLGSAAAAVAGPTALPGTTPSVYQGFFNTAPTGGVGTTPAGFAFARSFSQVLQVLFNKSTSLTSEATSGTFFPSGVGGTINGV